MPLTSEELQQGAVVKDILNTFQLRSAFLGGSQDLMSFIGQYRFEEPMSEEERLTLFCRLAAEYYDDFRISDEIAQAGNYSYPMIYPR